MNSVAELQNKLQELGRQLEELNERRMMLEVELSIIDTSERKVSSCSVYCTGTYYHQLASSNSFLASKLSMQRHPLTTTRDDGTNYKCRCVSK